jgi:hypothetical protein
VSADFHHNITHRLIFEVQNENLFYAISTKDDQIVKQGDLKFIDVDLLENLLAHNSVLNKIYSRVTLLYSETDFIIFPSQIAQNQDIEKLFAINSVLKTDQRLVTDAFDSEIHFAFAINQSYIDLFKKQYSNLEVKHEAELFYHKTKGSSGSTEWQIHAKATSTRLLLSVFKGSSLQLINYFDVKDHDDLFYYVMLACEQLEIDIEKTKLSWFNTSAYYGQEINTLFENYIGTVQAVPQETINGSTLSWSISHLI